MLKSQLYRALWNQVGTFICDDGLILMSLAASWCRLMWTPFIACSGTMVHKLLHDWVTSRKEVYTCQISPCWWSSVLSCFFIGKVNWLTFSWAANAPTAIPAQLKLPEKCSQMPIPPSERSLAIGIVLLFVPEHGPFFYLYQNTPFILAARSR